MDAFHIHTCMHDIVPMIHDISYMIYDKKHIIYVENGMYQRHLARKFKLRPFSMENDCKNSAVLMSMVLEQIENCINSQKKCVTKVQNK